MSDEAYVQSDDGRTIPVAHKGKQKYEVLEKCYRLSRICHPGEVIELVDAGKSRALNLLTPPKPTPTASVEEEEDGKAAPKKRGPGRPRLSDMGV